MAIQVTMTFDSIEKLIEFLDPHGRKTVGSVTASPDVERKPQVAMSAQARLSKWLARKQKHLLPREYLIDRFQRLWPDQDPEELLAIAVRWGRLTEQTQGRYYVRDLHALVKARRKRKRREADLGTGLHPTQVRRIVKELSK